MAQNGARQGLLGLGIALLFVTASNTLCHGQSADRTGPRIEDYATIEAYVGDVPVYAFGYTYVYGVSPDLLPGVVMQDANGHPITKVKPKKSWEIESNLCGSTPAREPKTAWNDDQPLLPIHLIDGDPETAWSSRGGTAPDIRPEWIRIDLPAEATVASVALVCSKTGPNSQYARPGMLPNIGKSLPKKLTIKLSRDGKQWDTVYKNAEFSGPDSGPTRIAFEPRRAKMIWVRGQHFARVGGWGHAFSIGELEVHDAAGNNLALVSRGAGVQVSTTYYGYGMDRFTQEMLWPIQYDLGFKWTRVGYDMGMYLWSYVEREKGKLRIDAQADAAVTEAHRNGVNVILCLDKANWLYRDPPRKTDWKRARTREMMETYYDEQGWPHESDALLAGYLRYVDYMVRHFTGRVAYYEICNEWRKIGFENYMKIARATIPVIRKADPNAKIMLGSVGGFQSDTILDCLAGGSRTGIRRGQFVTYGKTIAVVDKVHRKDVTVRVDASNRAEAGILLRCKDRANFLLAIYVPQRQAIYFHETVGGNTGEMLDRAPAEGLGAKVRLVAETRGNKATLTVSDGEKSYSTEHTIQKIHDAGGVGLFHNLTPAQRFDNFTVSDADGRIIFEDRFDGPDGPVSDWDTGVRNAAHGEKLAPLLDAVAWHPWYQTDPDKPAYRAYRQDVARFKEACAALGFKGKYVASEWTWAAPYPGAPAWCTEMTKAKYAAQLMTAHCGMGVISLYNETFQTGRIDWDVTLLRNSSFQCDPITPAQPQPIYYVLRNISTVMNGFIPADFVVRFGGDPTVDCYTFRRGEHERMFAAWIPGKTRDGVVESKRDITLPGIRAGRAWVVDVFNGTEQELNITATGSGTALPAMRIKDYPVFVRITGQRGG